MKPLYCILLVLSGITTIDCSAQRQWGIYDSTFYVLNIDTTIIAGRHQLYFKTNAGLIAHHDFTQSDPDFYIRDFDIAGPGKWYVTIGNRYIGDVSNVYKTVNSGNSWQIDTSFFSASRFHPLFTNYNSVNQLQVIGRDSLVLFIGYYESGIVYSTNGGNTWSPWFHNLIQHYHGFIICGNNYFLYSHNGDAFSASMFRIPRHLLFSPDTNNAWKHSLSSYHPPCYNGPAFAPGCIYPPSDSNSFRSQYNFFRDTANAICQTLSTHNIINEKKEIDIYPNPASGFVTFKINHFDKPPYAVKMFSIMGQLIISKEVKDNAGRLDISDVTSGLYILSIGNHDGSIINKRLIIR